MLQLTSPSSLLRVLGAAYVYALHQLGPWNLGMELHPWMILPMCLLNILWLHVPALWSGRVNLQLCVAHLEGTVQYFAILLLIVVYWGGAWRSAHRQRSSWPGTCGRISAATGCHPPCSCS